MFRSRMTRRDAVQALAGMAAMAGTTSSWAQDTAKWPDRPVRVVVPVASGGIIDLLARAVGESLAPTLGQPLVVESRPGADHLIGIQNVAKSSPDGYSWLCASVPFTVNPALRKAPGYDPVGDFRPLCLIATSPNVLVVHPDVQARSLAQFIELAKREPGKLTYGNPGNGSSNHLGMELFKSEAGIDLLGIPYKGQPPSISDLLAGRLDCMLMSVSLAKNYIQAGQLRPLAAVAPQRIDALPDVPTMNEGGYPGVDVVPWFGLLATGKTPDAVIEKASAALHAAMQTPKLQASIRNIGATPYPAGTPAVFEKLIQAELAKWPAVLSRAGIEKT
ncbi:Bug family tripartite tricarboxylate transporter substrate binding protein [Bordetella petrii]|uniref:Bug family tripartite tricarboxylate transporter substrate binding protein n=1 Tax=Bordetella petrii TaxID=94624 RepID=UPI001E33F397|nr:tripartite tricarboxylate transporter substrate-binding protein [Bordetella petrii]MCD0502536.1 tripartite tricarboxylate transporter substrate binding protein [Bordetella petrii]